MLYNLPLDKVNLKCLFNCRLHHGVRRIPSGFRKICLKPKKSPQKNLSDDLKRAKSHQVSTIKLALTVTCFSILYFNAVLIVIIKWQWCCMLSLLVIELRPNCFFTENVISLTFVYSRFSYIHANIKICIKTCAYVLMIVIQVYWNLIDDWQDYLSFRWRFNFTSEI